MKVLAFEFDRTWVKAIESQFENPIECLKKVAEKEGGVIVLSASYYFMVRGEEEQRKSFINAIIGHIVNSEWELNPFRYMKITGDIEGLEAYIAQLDKELENRKEQEVENLFEELEQRLSDEGKEEEQEELQLSKRRREPESKMPIPPVRPKRDLPATIEKICNGVPEKYSSTMAKYIRELGMVIPMLKSMGMEKNIWSRNLLVAIDSGYGYNEFLNDIAEVFYECELISNGNNKKVQEFVIKQSDRAEDKYRGWDNALNQIASLAQMNQLTNQVAVLSIDIGEWISELQTERVSDYLRKISAHAGQIICVFKVPFVEASVLHKIAERLADVMPIQAMSVPCISMESMVTYLQEQLEEAGFEVEEKSCTYFEQWVMKERCDDSFYGYETLKKMVQELIYKKALLNCERDEISYTITEEDMQAFLEEPYTETDPYKLLNDLIGIVSIKQYIKELVIQIKTQKELADKGQSVERPCIHMMFSGSPGTGKTTVARILARILKEEGVLRKGLFFEVHGRSLCGTYIGHTAPKTSAFCRDAYGSVLFIDEAYSLYEADSDKDYGREAIHTLIAEMENHRDDFCVILAGYKKEMHKMFEANPGLESRIPYEIEFPNYKKEELEEIFFAMLNGKFEYSDSLRQAAHQFFATLPEAMLSGDDFSNARFVRNIYEKVWGKAAYRRNIEGGEKIIIQKVDFDSVVETMDLKTVGEEKTKRRIGFC